MIPWKRDKTIRSETIKVFGAVFGILLFVGVFTILATYRGSRTFESIRDVQIYEYKLAESLQRTALEIIATFYLVGGNHDLDLQMERMLAYDGLSENFSQRLKELESRLQQEGSNVSREKTESVKAIGESFAALDTNGREMTIANMEGRVDDGRKHFVKVNQNIDSFKSAVARLEAIVNKELEDSSEKAQGLLERTMLLGLVLIACAIFITIGLNYYLMKFLSITLLPISNLMDNMRQAVFSIDANGSIIPPVSKYSSHVFGQDITQSNAHDLLFSHLGRDTEAYAGFSTAMISVFGEDEIQWEAMEHLFPQYIHTVSQNSSAQCIIKLTYAPLYDKAGLVRSIMIVAEDVTELERMRRTASQSLAEVRILQDLMAVDRGDVESFLSNAVTAQTECNKLFKSLSNDAESRKLLFRTLHTLKGNARLYSLRSISEAVHQVESSVTSLNQHFQSSSAIPSDLYGKIHEGMKNLEVTLAVHAKAASRLFKIPNLSARQMARSLVENFICLEYAHYRGKIELASESSRVHGSPLAQHALGRLGLSVGAMVREIMGYAEYFEHDELTEAARHLLTRLDAGAKLADIDLNALRRAYGSWFVDSPLTRAYGPEVQMMAGAAQILADLEESRSFDNSEMRIKFLDAIYELYIISDHEGMILLRFASHKLILATLRESVDGQLVDEALTEAWTDIALWQSLVQSAAHGVSGNDTLSGERTRPPVARFSKETWDELSSVSETLRQDVSRLLEGGWPVSSEGGLRRYLVGWKLESAATRMHCHYLYQSLTGFEAMSRGAKDSSERSYAVTVDCYERIVGHIGRLGVSPLDQVSRRIVEQLTEEVSSIFDYPVKSLCSKMRPMVKEIADELSRKVNFSVTGDNVRLPRETSSALRDALVHMLLNAIDHGLESPEVRKALGKSLYGRVEIRTERYEGGIRVYISDDGQGIDIEALTSKALALGFVKKDQLASMTDREKLDLIFMANLSIKPMVTKISGRGVGMDAVRTIVQRDLKGTMRVESRPREGTTFVIDIPRKAPELDVKTLLSA